MAFTANAQIVGVESFGEQVSIKIHCSSKAFSLHHEFDCRALGDVTRIMSLLSFTKSKNVSELTGKTIRIIDTGMLNFSLVAIGSCSRNKFFGLTGNEFTVSEKRIYRRYHLTKA